MLIYLIINVLFTALEAENYLTESLRMSLFSPRELVVFLSNKSWKALTTSTDKELYILISRYPQFCVYHLFICFQFIIFVQTHFVNSDANRHFRTAFVT